MDQMCISIWVLSISERILKIFENWSIFGPKIGPEVHETLLLAPNSAPEVHETLIRLIKLLYSDVIRKIRTIDYLVLI